MTVVNGQTDLQWTSASTSHKLCTKKPKTSTI